ncbi:hypothetical protein [Ornithinibacillus californiensis]|uniref:hypothetical protein n=1 Tax=Ornithinibacillus californiensis TaxID=161536 RepID=UPI00064DB747|nr:hypothetical protein [Ornithinibacillus californiensis]
MKKLTKILYFSVALLFLVGCVGNTNEENQHDITENQTGKPEESTSNSSLVESESDDVNDNSLEENSNEDTKAKETLSNYSSEQIEYARIWLQLGPNQKIDNLYVTHIPVGEPVNPNDDTSASYPEDVIQLAGSRLVDGSVTYSGNGDGTINVYNVPLRWESNVPPDLDENYMREYTEEIINNTELVYVDAGDDKAVIELIKLLKQ